MWYRAKQDNPKLKTDKLLGKDPHYIVFGQRAFLKDRHN
jgi:hypothetical protein